MSERGGDRVERCIGRTVLVRGQVREEGRWHVDAMSARDELVSLEPERHDEKIVRQAQADERVAWVRTEELANELGRRPVRPRLAHRVGRRVELHQAALDAHGLLLEPLRACPQEAHRIGLLSGLRDRLDQRTVGVEHVVERSRLRRIVPASRASRSDRAASAGASASASRSAWCSISVAAVPIVWKWRCTALATGLSRRLQCTATTSSKRIPDTCSTVRKASIASPSSTWRRAARCAAC